MEFLRIPLVFEDWARPMRKNAFRFRADACMALREFHIRRDVREEYGLEHGIFSLRGNVVLANIREARNLTRKINAKIDPRTPEKMLKAGQLNAMGLIDEILHYMVALYRERIQADVFETALDRLGSRLGSAKIRLLLETFSGIFPPQMVYAGKVSAGDYLEGSDEGESNKALALEEIMLLALANLNPAFKPFLFMFDDRNLEAETVYNEALDLLRAHLADLPPFGPDGQNLWDLLRAPALASPDSLTGQLDFMRRKWGVLLGKFLSRILMGLDVIKEEDKPSFFGPGPSEALTFGGLDEYERFSPDQDWMPNTVLLAKSTLVWLFQLSRKYGREITRLDQIPDEELDDLAHRGFTGLWLIGLWERSNASRIIKQWTGNPEAAASAYSLYDYDIAGELGGWEALANLRDRCYRRGIRLGSDMVPNHTGIDSRWMMEHPDRFLQLPYTPFPAYNYNCGNLSGRDDITVQIEEHYFDHSDCAVVFKRTDNRTGETRYIYHGNDGTSMPWNDTAQIDFLNEEAREAVIRTIIGVCRQFPIVRFDAAMTLAKRHIQRLWYPEPGRGGDIASRSEHAVSAEEFNRRIPNEFWREVVDRCAVEAPNTLLLAEAFWMMEGYFVRTLGMHRVYNSAFMNMLKKEENSKYRDTIKNTLEFDPEVLKRFVNFMNNPDEETAAAQFGKGDKYFGICTLLVTMPGLPMFGHGQIEGFEEKYGMEYRRSYRDENPDQDFVERHEREIFPLMKKRYLFSGSAGFCLFDLWDSNGYVNENVFAYTNSAGNERALVLFNNAYSPAAGWIREGSANIPQKDGSSRRDSLCRAIGLRGEDRCFVLLREQRQNRWFIRSSKEIAERGLFVSLNGYQAQVFLDIHEVTDSAPGSAEYRWDARWSKLNAELNGEGVWDLDAALKDIFLGELYAPIVECFTHGRFAELSALVTASSARKKEAAVFAESFEKPAETFIAGAFKFLDGADGRYEPFPAAPAKDKAARNIAAPAPDSKAVQHAVKDFIVYLEALLTLGKGEKKPETKPSRAPAKPAPRATADSKNAGAEDAAAAKILHTFAEAVSAKPVIAAFGLGYGLLRLLRAVLGKGAGGGARDLAEYWGLDRKLREAFEGLGVPGGEAWRVIEIMKAVLARTGAAAKAAPLPELAPLALALALENYDAGDFRSILKASFFESTFWFNKEAFEEALFYIPLFALLEYGQARAKTIAGVAEQFRKAEAVSQYKLDRLVDSLAAKTKKAAGAAARPGKADTGKENAGAKEGRAKPRGRVDKKK
ncbi:MAG: alpha-amylase [Spirochaetaceae bacterium]|nr:alpha-amylase [Spirochaetaceae bacterium]